ncbi:amidohydrolase, putative [Babesia ovis]|uniref:Amidohydrolase, putative n=1 Tax=Babesia ovis TaxID=5869 RepID=A0A9W5TDY1_BABOV|nr:amidohydrolase, putative [Babesia ovis]
MDWRSIGSSFTPAIESKRQYQPPKCPFETVTGDAKPPKYQRWQYIVGVDLEYQAYILQKLDENYSTGSRSATVPKGPLAITDRDTPLCRYYTEGNRLYDGGDTLKKRTESFRELTLDASVVPSLDSWLSYTRIKAAELVANLQHNDAGVPESMLPRISQHQEREVAMQTCELLHKLCTIIKKTRVVQWKHSEDSSALAYLFTILLFYKKFLVPDFDHVLDAVKWIKTWSNDYIRINDLRPELGVDLHRSVSTEPVYWEYISGIVLRAKMPHSRFLKVTQFFFNHLVALLRGPDRDKVERSIVVLLTECIIPRCLLSGHHDLGINTVRHWLEYTLFNNNGCSNFGNLLMHDVLHSLGIVQRDSCADKALLMDLCDAVDAMLQQSNGKMELGYLSPLDYCKVAPFDINKAPFPPIKLTLENSTELLFRILELFGSESVDRHRSNAKWYNLVKSVVIDTECSRNFRILLLLHAVIARPKSKLLCHLLMRSCNSKELSKKILGLNTDYPELWTSYANLTANIADAHEVYKQSVAVFPDNHVLMLSWVMFTLEHRPCDLAESTKALHDALEIEDLRDNLCDQHNFDRLLCAITPSKECATAVLWTLSNRDRLGDVHYRNAWNQKVASLSEYDMIYIFKLVYVICPFKTTQKLGDYILGMHGNNEQLIALHLRYNIARGNKPAIQRLLSREHIAPLVSLATRHIHSFCCYPVDANVFASPARLMLLSRLDKTQRILKACLDDPMPFNLPHVRLVAYVLEHTPKSCDGIDLVSRHGGFSKALWLILLKHLLASSEMINEDMTMHGVNV